MARILQLKDKVEKEDEESNEMPYNNHNKAYSVGTRMMGGGGPMSDAGKLSSKAGGSHFNNGFLSGASKSNYSRGTTDNTSNI